MKKRYSMPTLAWAAIGLAEVSALPFARSWFQVAWLELRWQGGQWQRLAGDTALIELPAANELAQIGVTRVIEIESR